MNFPAPLNSLSDIEQMVIQQYIQTLHFGAEDTIFQEGELPDGCYLVDDGVVRIELPHRRSNPDDEDDVLAYMEAGSILGELSLLDRLPRSASAIAHTDVIVRRIGMVDFDNLITTFPHIAVNLLMALGQGASTKLRQANERLESLAGGKVDARIEEMIEQAELAQQEILSWSESEIDALLLDLAETVYANAEILAEAAVQETHLGNVRDKIIKNHIASLKIYETLVGEPGYGVVSNTDSMMEIASPVGIIFGLIPATNPTSTFIFKTLIAIKSRNALILSPHRRTVAVSNQMGELIQGVLVKHGAPRHLIQWVSERSTSKLTRGFMSHPKIGLIMATGGASMVKAAYSSGNPAIGIAPGNAPALISTTADLDHAAQQIVMSKAFDNGLICGSEHNLVVVDSVRDAFINALELHGAAVLSAEEAEAFIPAAIDLKNHFKVKLIGQNAAVIAKMTGIERPYPIQVIVVPIERVNADDPFSHGKMLPVLSLFSATDDQHGIELCRSLLEIDGLGHTAMIYAQDETLIKKFGLAMPASRILVNSPGVFGVIGISTDLHPSLTLSCGTWAGNSTTDNITYRHLTNIKRLAYHQAEKLSHFTDLTMPTTT